MDIKKLLPAVVLNNGMFRVVALKTTDQVASDHASHTVIDLNPEEEDYAKHVKVHCVFERVQYDSLGNESWSPVQRQVAVNELFSSSVRDQLGELASKKQPPSASKTVQTDSTKSTKK